MHTATDVDAAWTSWLSTFSSVVDKEVPSKVIKNIKRKNPCVTLVIEISIKEKRKALRLLQKHPSTANRKEF